MSRSYIRIFTEDPEDEGIQWTIDVIDGDGPSWVKAVSFDTWDEAVAYLPVYYGLHVLGIKISTEYPPGRPDQDKPPAVWRVYVPTLDSYGYHYWPSLAEAEAYIARVVAGR